MAAAVVTIVMIMTLATANTTEAAVPGLSFTETGCEEYSDSVARLYKAGFDRHPDEPGFDYWLGLYQSGALNLHRMATLFTESEEFVLTYGSLGTVDFVELMYQNVLGRDGEQAGVDYWSGRINGGLDRGSVLLNFAESPENVTGTQTTDPALGPFNSGLPGPWECLPPLGPTVPHGPTDVHNCSDFATQAAAQEHFRALYEAGYGDVDGLDGDNDGVACERNPGRRDERPPSNF